MSLVTSAATRNSMNDILNKNLVLVLHRNWQAIKIRTPADAFCQMATNVATALDIELGDGGHAQALRPVKWDEWITLPIRDGDNFVRTAHSVIRVPTVIVAVNFAKVPKKRPKLSPSGGKCVRRTDEGASQQLPAGQYVALLSHSGSRGTGAAVCDHYSKIAFAQFPDLPSELKRLAWLSLDSQEGQEYWPRWN